MEDHETVAQLRKLNKALLELALERRNLFPKPKESPLSQFRKYSLCLPNRAPYANQHGVSMHSLTQNLLTPLPVIFIPPTSPHFILLVFNSVEEAKQAQQRSPLPLRRYAGARNLGGWEKKLRLDMVYLHRVPKLFYEQNSASKQQAIDLFLQNISPPVQVVSWFCKPPLSPQSKHVSLTFEVDRDLDRDDMDKLAESLFSEAKVLVSGAKVTPLERCHHCHLYGHSDPCPHKNAV